MKADIRDIKTALKWLMKNTNDDHILVEIAAERIILRAMDKLSNSVKITIYTSGTQIATITKTERLDNEPSVCS